MNECMPRVEAATREAPAARVQLSAGSKQALTGPGRMPNGMSGPGLGAKDCSWDDCSPVEALLLAAYQPVHCEMECS